MKNLVKALLEGESSTFIENIKGVLSEKQDAVVEDLVIMEGNPINKLKKNAAEAAMGEKDKGPYFTPTQMKKIRDMVATRGAYNGTKYGLSFKSKEIHAARQKLNGKRVNEDELNEDVNLEQVKSILKSGGEIINIGQLDKSSVNWLNNAVRKGIVEKYLKYGRFPTPKKAYKLIKQIEN